MVIRDSVKRLHKDRRGQATVELIIITPMIIFLFLVIVDFSLALRDAVMVANSVREGARLGALGGSNGPPQITNTVVQRSSGLVQAGEVQVGYPEGQDRGDPVVVKVQHQYGFKFLSNIFPIAPTMTLTSCAAMRLEIAANSGGGGVTC